MSRGARLSRSADIPLLESFAEQASLALEYARAVSEISRLGMIEDRERIARDLHDGVIQSLFAVGIGLQGTAAVVGDSRLADRIQQFVSEIDRVIGDVRSYIFGLRPSMLSAGNLTNTLEQLAHEIEERTGVTVIVEIDASLEARSPTAPRRSCISFARRCRIWGVMRARRPAESRFSVTARLRSFRSTTMGRVSTPSRRRAGSAWGTSRSEPRLSAAN